MSFINAALRYGAGAVSTFINSSNINIISIYESCHRNVVTNCKFTIIKNCSYICIIFIALLFFHLMHEYRLSSVGPPRVPYSPSLWAPYAWFTTHHGQTTETGKSYTWQVRTISLCIIYNYVCLFYRRLASALLNICLWAFELKSHFHFISIILAFRLYQHSTMLRYNYLRLFLLSLLILCHMLIRIIVKVSYADLRIAGLITLQNIADKWRNNLTPDLLDIIFPIKVNIYEATKLALVVFIAIFHNLTSKYRGYFTKHDILHSMNECIIPMVKLFFVCHLQTLFSIFASLCCLCWGRWRHGLEHLFREIIFSEYLTHLTLLW